MDIPLSLQQLTGAAERLRTKRVDRGTDWLALVESARAHSARQPFRAKPLKAFRKRNDQGKTRLLTKAAPVERLIEEALRPLLEDAVAEVASDCVHGYRRGRSTYTAALAASRGLADGCVHILAADIHSFFERIDWTILDQQLKAVLPESVAALSAALAHAPLRFGPHVQPRKRGIPLGRVISPYLANLYLAAVDAEMATLRGRYVRYADDLLLLTDCNDSLDAAHERLEQALGRAQLKLNPGKTRRETYTGQPILYLGHAIDERGVYDRVAGTRLSRIEAGGTPSAPAEEDAAEPAPRRSHTLYLTEPGVYLHIQSGMLIIRRRQELVREIPLHRIDRVLVLTGASMSSGFFAECIARQIPVLFFIGKGKAFGSLVASGMPNPWRLRAQYELHSDQAHRLRLAREIVIAKIQAMQRHAQRTPDTGKARAALAQAANQTANASDLQMLRGCEGRATRAWYEVFAIQIKRPEFTFKKRSKRPPRDPVNSLLSFCYSLIFAEMQTALLADGLDPHPALLHEARPGHAALASDLIEPYRILIADTFVRGLINRRRIHPDDFQQQKNGGFYLNTDGRRRTLEAFETHMTHPGSNNSRPVPRRAMTSAAASMLRVVLGDQQQLELPTPYERRQT